MRGGQWQALHLMAGLAERGHKVRLLAPAGSPLLQAAADQKLDSRVLNVMAVIAARGAFDLIHAHDARAHTLAIMTGIPVVVSRRVAFPVQRTLLSRWKYRRASHYIAVSECVRRTLMEAGIDPIKITVVYDGVPVPPTVSAGPRTRVVALDSDDPLKGKKIVERAAALAGIKVHFSKNLLEDFPQAALFVYITDLEGLGSAALVAMANGVPVLASRIGGLPEIIEDGVTGFLTSNEPEQIAHAIKRLLADPPFASSLAAHARARVEEGFSVRRMIEETVRVYQKVHN